MISLIFYSFTVTLALLFLFFSYIDEQLPPWLDDDLLFWFQGPHFAAVNSNNEIIVTDFHNHSVKVSAKPPEAPLKNDSEKVMKLIATIMCFILVVQVFNTEGEFLLKFGSNGEGNGQFNAPTGVAVDVNGNIIVADWGNSRIQVSARSPTLNCHTT